MTRLRRRLSRAPALRIRKGRGYSRPMSATATIKSAVFYTQGGAACVSHAEAARRLRISRQAVEYLIREGKLQTRAFGPRNFVLLSSLEAYEVNPRRIKSGRLN